MDDFLDQVEVAASVAQLYYLALAGALVIPDICGAMEVEGGEATGPLYKGWFNRHVAPLYTRNGSPILSGEDCWLFRCSFLHQGRTQHPKSGYTRIMFIEPGATPSVMHMCTFPDALAIDVRLFCLDLVNAARQWLTGVKGTEPYETNLSAFVRRYPNGLHRYIGPIPVIS